MSFVKVESQRNKEIGVWRPRWLLGNEWDLFPYFSCQPFELFMLEMRENGNLSCYDTSNGENE